MLSNVRRTPSRGCMQITSKRSIVDRLIAPRSSYSCCSVGPGMRLIMTTIPLPRRDKCTWSFQGACRLSLALSTKILLTGYVPNRLIAWALIRLCHIYPFKVPRSKRLETVFSRRGQFTGSSAYSDSGGKLRRGSCSGFVAAETPCK